MEAIERLLGPKPSPLTPRISVIRWQEPLPYPTLSEPPLSAWLVDAALDGKRRKPIRVVYRLLQHLAPTFDTDPKFALAESLGRPWAVHGLEYRPPTSMALWWRTTDEPDSYVWFRDHWYFRYGTKVVEVGLRGDMHLPGTHKGLR